ncbi:hypothetical protein NBRC116583_23700 [Arenicella sp. 4NH20-0111]|uniref:SMC-Scp complex subunit ScpB n=1 Tax=Arenicella sp. 4NH20-0111 TaxID=3127648 RepID=UPI003102BA66
MKQKDINMADGDVNSVDSQGAEERLEDDLNPQDPPDDSELANIIEAALYAANEPLGIRKLASLFSEDAQPSKVDIQNVILVLQEQCEHRGIELRRIGIGWRYQTKEKYAPWLRKLSGQKSPRYSRALLETLSIIAYRQPVTRGDIEEVRGVGVSSDTIRTLEERGWIAQIGHRDVPGRPSLFGTTQVFLEYFNMASLSELPELMEKRELRTIAQEMNLTLPMDGVQNETNTSEAQLTDAEAEPEQAGSANVVELHPSHDTNENDSGVASSEGVEPKLDASNAKKNTTSDESDEPEGVS